MPYNSVIELINLNQSSIPAAFIPSRAASSGIEPKATNCIKIDSVSSPILIEPPQHHHRRSLFLHTSSKSLFLKLVQTHRKDPWLRPGRDSKVRSKCSILRKPISLIIRMVYFLPLIADLMNLTGVGSRLVVAN